MYSTPMCRAYGRYLEFSTRLKELAIIGKSLGDYGDGCTGIQECPHSHRCRIFKADCPSGLDNIA
jgi:hypothetical protein